MPTKRKKDEAHHAAVWQGYFDAHDLAGEHSGEGKHPPSQAEKLLLAHYLMGRLFGLLGADDLSAFLADWQAKRPGPRTGSKRYPEDEKFIALFDGMRANPENAAMSDEALLTLIADKVCGAFKGAAFAQGRDAVRRRLRNHLNRRCRRRGLLEAEPSARGRHTPGQS